MHKLGLGLGLNMIRSLSTQAQRDAVAYAALLSSAGGTNIVSNGQRDNLIAFATALYAVAGRVDFWPLRSAQNMGTGTTAYSFQGVSATLTSGMTWHANGLASPAGSGANLVIPSYAGILCVNPVSSIFVGQGSGTVWFSDIYWFYGNNYGVSTNQNSGGWLRAAAGVDVINQMRGSTELNAAAFTHGAFAMFSNTTTGAGSNNSVTYKNGGAPHTSTCGTTISPATSGASSYQVGAVAGTTASGNAAFHLVTPQNLDATAHAAIYAAYKANLGSGLSLP